MIYLDYQATTPLAPEVRGAMMPWITDKFANPHAAHKMGREAAALVEVARESVAALLPEGGSVYFTSGATEALNWALSCAGKGGIAFPDTEHAAVRDTIGHVCRSRRESHMLSIDAQGLVDPTQPLPDGVGVVAAMHVNNEIGVIQPISDISKRAHDVDAVMVCDAVQGFGRIPIPEGPDLIAISAHKIHGPKGIGALWVKDGVRISPMLHGGGQEGGLRSGTLSPGLCIGFGTAAALARQRMDEDNAHASTLWDMAVAMLPSCWAINGSTEKRYKGNLSIRREGLDVARLISELRDVAFAAGSACASGSGRPSHVLKALGLSEAEARNSIRIGFGRYTTPPELKEGLRLILAAAEAQK